MKFRLIHGIALVTVLMVLSSVFRAAAFSQPGPFFRKTDRDWNADAQHHVLDVLVAYRQIPLASHALLPIWSVSSWEAAAGRTDRSTVPDLSEEQYSAFALDVSGNVAYLSFPPGGFVLPHLFFLLIGMAPSKAGLTVLNLMLQLAAAWLLMVLLFVAAGKLFRSSSRAWWASALVAGTVAVWAVEPLHSHFGTYWGHQALQPFIPALALVLLFTPGRRIRLPALFALGLVMPSLEWTGFLYVFGGALIARFGLSPSRPAETRSEQRKGAWALFGGGLLSGIGLLGLYAARVGLGTYFDVLLHRADVRASAMGHSAEMLQWLAAVCMTVWRVAGGVWESFAPFVVVLTVLALWLLAAHVRRKSLKAGAIGRPEKARLTALAALLAIPPAAENILMSGHAALYTFDRLKWMFPIALALALMAALVISRPRRRRAVSAAVAAIVALLVLASIASAFQYYGRYGQILAGQPISALPAHSGHKTVIEAMAADLEQDRQALPMIATEERLFNYPFAVRLGERPLAVRSIDQAWARMERSGRERGRLYVVGGYTYLSEHDRLSLSGLTANLLLRAGSRQADISLHAAVPSQFADVRPSDPEAFVLHNPQVLQLVPPGSRLIAPNGEVVTVVGHASRSLLLDRPASGLTRLDGTIALDRRQSAASLLPPLD